MDVLYKTSILPLMNVTAMVDGACHSLSDVYPKNEIVRPDDFQRQRGYLDSVCSFSRHVGSRKAYFSRSAFEWHAAQTDLQNRYTTTSKNLNKNSECGRCWCQTVWL